VRLAWLELLDVRNHTHTHLREIPEGLTVVVGDNGEGKTNLLEGMYVLYALGSPRAASNEALVREGAEAAYARGEFETLDGRKLVEVEIPRRGASRAKLNRSPIRRRRDLRRQVRIVMFGPIDLHVVIGDPSKRRAFMDEAAIALRPAHDTLPTAFDKVLRQRNRLLKEWPGPGAPAGIEAWDEQLVQSGVALIRARRDAIRRVAPPASDEFGHLAGYGLQANYAPNVEAPDESLEESFRSRIAERRADELQRRTTLVGPHRDDLDLAVRDLRARTFGSHGETWAAALCLRMGLATAVADEIGEAPLLLVDDPFSALDPRRRDEIAGRLSSGRGQVVITVADAAHVPSSADAVWNVRAGHVAPREAA
jgi:DNA replication and repair protein RecF